LLDLPTDCAVRTTKNISYLPDATLPFQFGQFSIYAL